MSPQDYDKAYETLVLVTKMLTNLGILMSKDILDTKTLLEGIDIAQENLQFIKSLAEKT